MAKFYGKGEELATKSYVDNINTQITEQIIGQIAHMIALDYDNTISYVAGNYVIYDGKLYKCTASTSGEWDETCWMQTNVMGELSNI